jgi:serine/threonine-protein kinase
MTTLLSNRYQVLRVLGSGGFGQTFLAEDTQMPPQQFCEDLIAAIMVYPTFRS